MGPLSVIFTCTNQIKAVSRGTVTRHLAILAGMRARYPLPVIIINQKVLSPRLNATETINAATRQRTKLIGRR